MRLIMVRHGHPDYSTDTLTERGHIHAKVAAERLKDEGITHIYSSSCGRAVETAEHTANLLGLPILEKFDFMREIRWGVEGEMFHDKYHPWFVADRLVTESIDTRSYVKELPGYKNSVIWEDYDKVCNGFDEFLSTLGYKRNGLYYKCERENNDIVALFSHGGSSSCAMSHMLNIPFAQFAHTFKLDFTAICVFDFASKPNEIVCPEVRIMSDARHIKNEELFFGH